MRTPPTVELSYDQAIDFLNFCVSANKSPIDFMRTNRGKPIPLWEWIFILTGKHALISKETAVKLAQTTIYSLDEIKIAFGMV